MTTAYQMTPDMNRVRADLAPLLADGYRHEITPIYRNADANPYSDHSKIHAIITDDLETALAFIEEVDAPDVTGIYVVQNSVEPAVRQASWKRVESADVQAREYLFFDIDRRYNKKTAATPDELKTLRTATKYLMDRLTSCGFPLKPARFGISRNGYYIVYAVERMAVDDASYSLFDRILKAAAAIVEATYPTVDVDQAVKDAARLRRISGTVNRKFQDDPDTWSMVKLSVMDSEPVSLEVLERFAALAPSGDAGSSGQTVSDDDRHDLTEGEIALFAEAMLAAVDAGSRHDAGQCLGGLFAHNSVSPESALAVMRRASVNHNDQKDRLKSIHDAYDKKSRGEKVSWRGYADSIGPALTPHLEAMIRTFKTRVGIGVMLDANLNTDSAPDDLYQKPAEESWPEMDPAAFDGIAGEIVDVVEPSTEADRHAVLVSFLVMFGNAVGRGPHHLVGSSRHGTNLDAVLVGDSSTARKGDSKAGVEVIMRIVDEQWASHCQIKSLASGEGLIHAIRDQITGRNKKTGEDMIFDDGVQDKRLFSTVEEFAGILKVGQRSGNTLSPTIREAWDSPRILRNSSKSSPETATSPHISIYGHITPKELKDTLAEVDYENGLANRFLWIAVRRSKLIAHPRRMDMAAVNALAKRLSAAKQFAHKAGEIDWDDEAYDLWTELYENDLGPGTPGLVGSLTARGAPITIRLALIYALLDQSTVITAAHLRSAYSVWKYSEASVRVIFGDATGDHVADRILTVLREDGSEYSQSGISEIFGRNVNALRLGSALETLLGSGKIASRKVQENARGRPVTYYRAIHIEETATPPNVTQFRRKDDSHADGVHPYQATGTDGSGSEVKI